MKVEVYCDGATSKNGYDGAVGGYAVVILVDGCLRRATGYGPYTAVTNNQCEMMGFIEACKAIKEIYDGAHKDAEFFIYTDSAYVFNCYSQYWYKKWIKNNWYNSKNELVKNRELWEEIIPYFEYEWLKVEKVKGHANNKWNNLADELAVSAREGNPKELKGEKLC